MRRTSLLPWDDLLVIVREFLNAKVSRSGLDRCLRLHGVSNLNALIPKAEGEKVSPKTFRDYVPGYLHIDITYLPKMPNEAERSDLFVAIDRATRWVYFRIYPNPSQQSSADFLKKLKAASPIKINTILTDNGTQLTDRFTSRTKQSTGQATGEHALDRLCASLAIAHRLIPPRHPQTNGRVERFNGRISDIVSQARFKNAERESTLTLYLRTYNHTIPQRNLNHQTPIQSLKLWHKTHPELFEKKVYDQTGLDNYSSPKASRISAVRLIDWRVQCREIRVTKNAGLRPAAFFPLCYSPTIRAQRG